MACLSHGPFVYLGQANGTFTDVRSTCGFSNLRRFNDYDSMDWHGFSVGDYDNDGNVDLYIAEGAKGHSGGMVKRDLLFRGNGDVPSHTSVMWQALRVIWPSGIIDRLNGVAADSTIAVVEGSAP